MGGPRLAEVFGNRGESGFGEKVEPAVGFGVEREREEVDSETAGGYGFDRTGQNLQGNREAAVAFTEHSERDKERHERPVAIPEPAGVGQGSAEKETWRGGEAGLGAPYD